MEDENHLDVDHDDSAGISHKACYEAPHFLLHLFANVVFKNILNKADYISSVLLLSSWV